MPRQRLGVEPSGCLGGLNPGSTLRSTRPPLRGHACPCERHETSPFPCREAASCKPHRYAPEYTPRRGAEAPVQQVSAGVADTSHRVAIPTQIDPSHDPPQGVARGGLTPLRLLAQRGVVWPRGSAPVASCPEAWCSLTCEKIATNHVRCCTAQRLVQMQGACANRRSNNVLESQVAERCSAMPFTGV